MVAVVDCKEDYNAMGTALADIFQEINELSKDGKVEIDGQSVDVEMFIGGDMKASFLSLSLSLSLSPFISLSLSLSLSLFISLSLSLFPWLGCI